MDVNTLKGKTLKQIEITHYNENMCFYCTDGSIYELYHQFESYEQVSIEDISGDLDDLIGSPLLIAEKVKGNTEDLYNEKFQGVEEWTFYKFATLKGYVDVRWYGTSNGYYSTSVDFVEIKEKD